MSYQAPNSLVEAGALVGAGSKIWDLAHVRAGAVVGEDCIVGRGAFIDAGVTVGNSCKIQNAALLYFPARLADGVFIGPAVILTNDRFPRATTPDLALKSIDDWEPVGVDVELGASIGAGAVVIGGTNIGSWSLVAAGSVVTRDVAAHALVAGSPARRVGWVGRAGRPLVADEDRWVCPATAEQYVEVAGELRPAHG